MNLAGVGNMTELTNKSQYAIEFYDVMTKFEEEYSSALPPGDHMYEYLRAEDYSEYEEFVSAEGLDDRVLGMDYDTQKDDIDYLCSITNYDLFVQEHAKLSNNFHLSKLVLNAIVYNIHSLL